MASLEFHSIKDAKANAMRRYQKQRRLQTMLRLFNIGAALFVFSRSSWLSIAVHVFSRLHSKFALLFHNTFFMFLLGNVIILVVYALSDQAGGKSGGQSDIYDEFRNNSKSRLKMSAGGGLPSTVNNTEERSPENEIVTVNSSGDCAPEKEITPSELVKSPVLDKTVTAVTGIRTTRTTRTCCTTVSMMKNGEKVSERKCYLRVQSESFERRTVVTPRRELNRMTSEVGREPVRRLCSVEELTNEEFNRTVEDFIAKHKRKQREEHKGSHKTEYLAVAHLKRKEKRY